MLVGGSPKRAEGRRWPSQDTQVAVPGWDTHACAPLEGGGVGGGLGSPRGAGRIPKLAGEHWMDTARMC